MKPDETRGRGEQRTYVVDVTASPREGDAFERMTRSWAAQVGTAISIPPSTPIGESDYRIRIRHSKVGDVAVEDLYSESIVGTTGRGTSHHSDRLILHVGRRGTWHFNRPDGRGTAINMNGGQFVARLNDPTWDFGIGPKTRSGSLILPAAELRSLIPADGVVVGSVTSAPMRVLMAHAAMVQETLDELGPAGVTAARNALVELAKGLLSGGGVDAGEPEFSPALAAAARRIAEGLLTDPELSPAVLARELHVSVRTLQRAFAETGEPITAYVRRRRLECAREELARPGPQPSVSELAARYQFADSSHFIRLFKKEYGRPPARMTRLDDEAPSR
jgi:AraC family transcriptional regulator, positive regulator of tynA and feaB